jgi:RNA polymerase sigma factor (sigma-70 family)
MFSDEKLVEGCLKGKRSAQKMLYDRYAVKMLGVCLRYLKNREDAEDALQNGFVTVFLKLDTYRNDGPLGGWIRKIMVNTALQKIQYDIREKIQMDKYFFGTDLREEIPEEDDLSVSVSQEDLYQMISSLPDGYRTVFSLYAIDDYNHAEIAAMLGISEGTSKSQLFRARELLRKMIKEIQTSKQTDLKHA